MGWVIGFTAAAYIIVNLPLIYSLLAVEKPAGIGRLWGYAPNQFFFLVVVFPFATLATLTCVKILVTQLGPKLPDSYGPKWFFYDNWAAAMMIAVILAAAVALAAYLFSSTSLDKLQPAYAQRAIQIMSAIAKSGVAPKSSSAAIPPQGARQSVAEWLKGLNSHDYLVTVTDRSEQLRLGILDPTIHPLNMLQLLVGLTVAIIAVVAALLSADAMRHFSQPQNYPELQMALNAAFWAVVFFSAYPLCFRIWRIALEKATGNQPTIMQDLLALGLLVLVMAVLRYSDPANRVPSIQAAWGYLPVLFVGGAYASDIASPDTLNRVLGTEANPGTQIVVALMFVFFAVAISATIWPKTA